MVYRQLLAVVCAFCFVTSVNGYALDDVPHSGESCFSQVKHKIRNDSGYNAMYAALTPMLPEFETLVTNLLTNLEQANYDPIYDAAMGLAASTGAQVIVALQGGRVVVDTFQPADLNNMNCTDDPDLCNGFCYFMNSSVAPQVNNEVSVMQALLQECGMGVSIGLSPDLTQKTAYLTIRLGDYLDSMGTVSLAQVVTP